MDNRAILEKILLHIRVALNVALKDAAIKVYGRDWFQSFRDALQKSNNAYVVKSKTDYDQWDISPLVVVVLALWKNLSSQNGIFIKKNLYFEIREIRNAWGHQKRFGNDELLHSIYICENLLLDIGAPIPSFFGEIKKEALSNCLVDIAGSQNYNDKLYISADVKEKSKIGPETQANGAMDLYDLIVKYCKLHGLGHKSSVALTLFMLVVLFPFEIDGVSGSVSVCIKTMDRYIQEKIIYLLKKVIDSSVQTITSISYGLYENPPEKSVVIQDMLKNKYYKSSIAVLVSGKDLKMKGCYSTLMEYGRTRYFTQTDPKAMGESRVLHSNIIGSFFDSVDVPIELFEISIEDTSVESRKLFMGRDEELVLLQCIHDRIKEVYKTSSWQDSLSQFNLLYSQKKDIFYLSTYKKIALIIFFQAMNVDSIETTQDKIMDTVELMVRVEDGKSRERNLVERTIRKTGQVTRKKLLSNMSPRRIYASKMNEILNNLMQENIIEVLNESGCKKSKIGTNAAEVYRIIDSE